MSLYAATGQFQGIQPAPSGGLYDTSGNLRTPGAVAPAKSSEAPSFGGFVKNAVSSVGTLLSGIGKAIAHPLQTIDSASQMLAGGVEKGLGALGAKDINSVPLDQKNTPEQQSFGNVVDYFKQRYGGSNVQEVGQNIAQTAYKDPAGFLLDLSSLINGGASALGKVGEVAKVGELSRAAEVAGKVGEAINPITQGAAIAGKTALGVSKVAGKIGGEALGMTTGAGFGAVKEAFKNGGEAFTKAMRGETTSDQIVQTAKDALDAAKQARRTEYQNTLANIEDSYRKTSLSQRSNSGASVMQNNKVATAATPSILGSSPTAVSGKAQIPGELFNLSTQGLKAKLTTTLQDFGVDVSKNRTSLDFVNSPLPHPEEKLLKQMATDINKWSDITPTGLNKLGTKLGNYANHTNSPTLNAIATSLKRNIRSYVGERVPEVNVLNANYAEKSSFIKQAQKALSLGDNASIDTSFNKLASTLRGNNQFRADILKELQQYGGKDITGQIAGTALSGAVPRGIVGKGIEAVSGSAGLFLHDPTFILGLAAATPRVVGEFVRVLGLGTQTLRKWSAALRQMGAGSAASNLIRGSIYLNKGN